MKWRKLQRPILYSFWFCLCYAQDAYDYLNITANAWIVLFVFVPISQSSNPTDSFSNSRPFSTQQNYPLSSNLTACFGKAKTIIHVFRILIKCAKFLAQYARAAALLPCLSCQCLMSHLLLLDRSIISWNVLHQNLFFTDYTDIVDPQLFTDFLDMNSRRKADEAVSTGRTQCAACTQVH